MIMLLPAICFQIKIYNQSTVSRHSTYQGILMVKKKTQTGSGKTIARLKEKAAKKQKPARQPILQAMVWYKEEHYAELLAIFDDAELLPPTYQHWLARAEEKKS